MDRKTKRIIKLGSSLFVIVFFLIAHVINSQESRGKLEVDFLDVGQGDAILIKTPYEQNILIDGGPDNGILPELGNSLAFFDKELDLVILTHPHSDHVAGLVEVLRRYKVKKVLMTGVVHNAPDYFAFLEEIDKQDIETEIAKAQQEISFGPDLVLKVLYPWSDLSGQKAENINDTSVVTKLVYKNSSFLLTGDAEEIVELDLLNNSVDVSADVLKVAHHGSKYSSTVEFLTKVDPQYAVIQVGENNDFGHPHLRTLDNLQKDNIEILRTDQLGTIKFISDGNNLYRKN